MSSFRIFDIAASAMSVQNARLNTVASNLANTDSLSTTPEATYKARVPVFSAVVAEDGSAGVRLSRVETSNRPAEARYEPGHPLADEQGYVYAPAINPVEEMANMISAARSYQNAVDTMATSRDLMLATLRLGSN
jgi:flagellar basal-body rod protein FlgC